MWSDRVSSLGHLAYESDALLTAHRGLARKLFLICICVKCVCVKHTVNGNDSVC